MVDDDAVTAPPRSRSSRSRGRLRCASRKGQRAALLLIARPDREMADQRVGIALGRGKHGLRAGNVEGATSRWGTLQVSIVDSGVAALRVEDATMREGSSEGCASPSASVLPCKRR